MFSGRTTTTVSSPASVPIDLNSGKPEWRDIAPMLGIVLVCVLPMLLGGGMVVANWPDAEHAGGWAALWLGGGIVILAVFGRLVWILQGAIVREITDYQRRKAEWHDAALDKYLASDGQTTAHQISEWTYSEVDMRSVALAVLWLILEQPRSLSIERLTKGPMQLTVGHRAFKLMDMSQDGAGAYLNLLARAGIINGRGPRTAGTIAIMDPRQAALKVLAEAARNPAAIGTDEK